MDEITKQTPQADPLSAQPQTGVAEGLGGEAEEQKIAERTHLRNLRNLRIGPLGLSLCYVTSNGHSPQQDRDGP